MSFVVGFMIISVWGTWMAYLQIDEPVKNQYLGALGHHHFDR
jgi:hypothetical protein